MVWLFYQILPTKFFKKMYGDQFGEFVCGYWGLMSIIGLKQKKSGRALVYLKIYTDKPPL